MLRVSKLTDYAFVLLSELATHGHEPQSAQDLAQQAQLQGPMTSKALKRLAQAGMVSSLRGSQGGYQLIQAPEDISALQVIEVMEGPIALTACEGDDAQCELHDTCRVRPHWAVINHQLREQLKQLSLADLSRPPIVSLAQLQQASS